MKDLANANLDKKRMTRRTFLWTALAGEYRRRGIAQQAIAAYQRAISADPNDVTAYAELGDMHRSQGEEEEAEAFYRKYNPGSGECKEPFEEEPIVNAGKIGRNWQRAFSATNCHF